jgi:hypothetical protein
MFQTNNRQENIIRLEAFDTNIRSRKTLVMQSAPIALARIALLESESLFKGKSIFVYHTSSGQSQGPDPLLHRRQWDSVFRVKDNFDLQILASYVSNAPKPVRICWQLGANHEPIPRALWTRWLPSAKTDISLIGYSADGNQGGCEWDSILFPLKAEQSAVERVLSARGTGIGTVVAHLSELAGAGAALAWTNIDEKDARGSLYWYDPNEGSNTEDSFTRKEAGALLEALASWVTRH